MSTTPSLYPLRSGRAVNLWHYYWPEQDIRWQKDDHDNNNICVVRPLTTPQQRIVCIEYVHIVVAIVILSSLVWFSLVGRATSRKSTAIMRWGVLRQTWIHLLYTRIGELWHLLWHRQDDDATLIVRLTPSPLHCVGTLSGIIICDVRGHKQWSPNEELTYALPSRGHCRVRYSAIECWHFNNLNYGERPPHQHQQRKQNTDCAT